MGLQVKIYFQTIFSTESGMIYIVMVHGKNSFKVHSEI